MTEYIELQIKLSDGLDLNRATVRISRTLGSQEDDITVFWIDEYGDEVAHCYYHDLTKEQKKVVDKAIYDYDVRQIQKTL